MALAPDSMSSSAWQDRAVAEHLKGSGNLKVICGISEVGLPYKEYTDRINPEPKSGETGTSLPSTSFAGVMSMTAAIEAITISKDASASCRPGHAL